MNILAAAVLGLILGLLIGSYNHHWFNGTIPEGSTISDELKVLGKKIKRLELTMEEKYNLKSLRKYLSYTENEYLDKCMRESIFNKLNNN